ncbi:MAG: MBOAT family O-acyltransferase [Propionicimonas sp.]
MVFTSTVFLFAFLPVALVAFYLFPAGLRAWPLLVLSALFYGWGEPILVVLILFSAVLNFTFGRLLSRPGLARSRDWLVLGIVLNLVPLLVFKYLEWFLVTLGLDGLAAGVALPLPIGVSFYTFMAISYLVDIHRGRNMGAPSLLMFGAYLTMFPHLVAGPIVRWGHVGPQLRRPTFNPGLFGYGAVRVATGLVKKAVLADSISPVVDALFGSGAPTSWGSAWVAVLLYSLQIYLDFSAYSDIAIGLAAILGVRFEENFRYPYVSRSAREFWQRWHVSLGSWFRDYVYIPLGGSRVRPALLWRNLLVVWALTGLWHGAAWTFVLWGVYFGVLIGLERGALGRAVDRLPRFLQHGYGVLVVAIGWVLFRSESLLQASEYYRAMSGLSSAPMWDARATYAISQTLVVAAIATLLSASAARRVMEMTERFFLQHQEVHPWPVDHRHRPAPIHVPEGAPDAAHAAGRVATATEPEAPPAEPPARLRGWSLVAGLAVATLLLIGTSFVVSVTYSPFIYFRF